MKRISKKAWIDALRSGKYKQCTGALRKQQEDGTYGYCCLGVALDIAGFDWDAEYRASSSEYFSAYDPDGKYLKINAAFESDIAVINDGGVSFKRIATMIRNNNADLNIHERDN